MITPLQWLAGSLIIIAAALTLIVIGVSIIGDSSEWLGLMSELQTYFGLTLTALFASVGLTHDFKNLETNRITVWGKLAIAGTAASLALSVVSLRSDRAIDAQETRALLTEATRAANRIQAVSFFVRWEPSEQVIPEGWKTVLLTQKSVDPTGIDAHPQRAGYHASACAKAFPDFENQQFSRLKALFAKQWVFISLVRPDVAEEVKTHFRSFESRAPVFSNVLGQPEIVDKLLGVVGDRGMTTAFSLPLERFKADCSFDSQSILQLGFNSDDEVIIVGSRAPDMVEWVHQASSLASTDLDKYVVLFWSDLSDRLPVYQKYLSVSFAPGGRYCFSQQIEITQGTAGRLLSAPLAKATRDGRHWC